MYIIFTRLFLPCVSKTGSIKWQGSMIFHITPHHWSFLYKNTVLIYGNCGSPSHDFHYKPSCIMTRTIRFDSLSHTTWVSTVTTEIGFRGNHSKILFASDSTEMEIWVSYSSITICMERLSRWNWLWRQVDMLLKYGEKKKGGRCFLFMLATDWQYWYLKVAAVGSYC
jgi:hypothetical protein